MMLNLITILLLVLSIVPHSLSLTGCEVCASTGDCSQAFHNGPGQYCGVFHQLFATTRPCCCPTNTYCKVSYSDCMCHVPDTNHRPSGYYGYSTEENTAGGVFTLIVFIFICCCFARFCTPQTAREPHGEFIPVAVPVGINGNPPPTAPTYGSTDNRRTNNNGGGGGFAWGPALGGFVLGEMLGRGEGRRHHHHQNTGWGGWGRGGGGGFDIRGDSDGGGGGGFNVRGDS
mmetsp:Transcript_21734/g.24741  ORF Transcript_21734/g.24741 Transcript_21734/m.24741 type:complete len:230 (+) Transcript_21734:41-730(+)